MRGGECHDAYIHTDGLAPHETCGGGVNRLRDPFQLRCLEVSANMKFAVALIVLLSVALQAYGKL